MPRDHHINEERIAVLRDELARVRARVDQAVAERDAALGQLKRLAEFLIARRAVTDRVAVRLMRDMAVMCPSDSERGE